jgi:hypothetical protein
MQELTVFGELFFGVLALFAGSVVVGLVVATVYGAATEFARWLRNTGRNQ